MKAKILGLAVVLLAGAAEGALAQDQDRDGPPPAGPMTPKIMRHASPTTPSASPPPVSAQPPPLVAQQPWRREQDGARRPGWNRSDGGPRPGWTRQDAGHSQDSRPVEHDRRDEGGGPGPRPDAGRPQGERDRAVQEREPQDGNRRDDQRDDRAHWGQRPDSRLDYYERRPAQRGADERWRDDRHVPDWGDGRRDGGRDGNRDRREVRRWEPHRYPPSYRSQSRYRGPIWSPPYGYYAHVWRFGEILPSSWYEPEYGILDWWAYDLPEPPPGYEWVRVGEDALLIEAFSGRIVQVVRYVFW